MKTINAENNIYCSVHLNSENPEMKNCPDTGSGGSTRGPEINEPLSKGGALEHSSATGGALESGGSIASAKKHSQSSRKSRNYRLSKANPKRQTEFNKIFSEDLQQEERLIADFR